MRHTVDCAAPFQCGVEDAIRKQTVFLYQQKSVDGQIETAVVASGERPFVQLENKAGSWEIYPTAVLRLEFKDPLDIAEQDTLKLMAQFPDQLDFALLPTAEVRGTPCYQISVKLSDSLVRSLRLSICRALRSAGYTAANAQSLTTDHLAVRREYFVGQNDSQLYRKTLYDAENGVIADLIRFEITTNVAPPPELFTAPNELKVTVIRSLADYRKFQIRLNQGTAKQQWADLQAGILSAARTNEVGTRSPISNR